MNKIYILGVHNGEDSKEIFASHDKSILENKITELEKLSKSELDKLLMYCEDFYIEEVELI